MELNRGKNILKDATANLNSPLARLAALYVVCEKTYLAAILVRVLKYAPTGVYIRLIKMLIEDLRSKRGSDESSCGPG